VSRSAGGLNTHAPSLLVAGEPCARRQRKRRERNPDRPMRAVGQKCAEAK
jgi:hypothetical protein